MQKKIDTRKKKIYILGGAALLLILVIFFLLETTHVTNLFTSPPSNTTNTSGKTTVNDVNYGPPSNDEKNLGDQIKSDAQKQGENSTPTPSGTIDISLSAAGQDEVNGPIVVRAIVTAHSGTCTITLSGSGYSNDFSVPIENLETYYGCGTNIPIADIPAGSYTIKLTAASGATTGSVSQGIEVRK